MKLSTITLAIFMKGDMGDKAQMHAVRLDLATQAIDKALRGNATEYDSAVVASAGKGKRAKAYAAAFAAIGRPAKFDYTGKLSAEIAARIAERAAELAAQWSEAFLSVCPLEDAGLSEADKAKRKAAKDAKFNKAAQEWAEANGYTRGEPSKGHAIADMGPAAIADAIGDMVRAGAFDLANLRTLSAAIAPALKAAEKADKAAQAKAREAEARKAEAEAEAALMGKVPMPA